MAEQYLRRANRDDVDLLFRWVNDDAVRNNALASNKKKIKYAEHTEWFEKKLKFDDSIIYIYCDGDTLIGQARVDIDDDGCALISYSIDAAHRLLGHVGKLLILLEAVVKSELTNVTTLTAKVKKGNIASQRKFEQLNYRLTDKETHYEYHKPVDSGAKIPVITDDSGEGVVFLTNNRNTLKLFDWLLTEEKNVCLFSEKLTLQAIEKMNPNMLVSYNYSYIIKPDVLDYMDGRVLNLHISLLPWNRGSDPNLWSFIEGTPAGVTIHKIDEGLDTGDILLQQEIEFDYEKDTLKSAYEKSHALIQELFIMNWKALKNSEIMPKKQQGNSTYHCSAYLKPYSEIIDYDDTIAVFLQKAAQVNASQ